MSEDKGKPSVFDMVDSAVKAWQDNKDTIKSLVGEESEYLTEGNDPLFESHSTDNRVRIVADVAGKDFEKINIKVEDGKAQVKAGGNDITVPVPEDTVEDSVSAMVNNGVLEITMRREGSDE